MWLVVCAHAPTDFFLREGKYLAAARFSVISERPMSRVVESFLGRAPESSTEAPMSASDLAMRGLLAYLDSVLFQTVHLDRIDETAAVANRILRVRLCRACVAAPPR